MFDCAPLGPKTFVKQRFDVTLNCRILFPSLQCHFINKVHNEIIGPIPSEIGELTHLTKLRLGKMCLLLLFRREDATYLC